MSTNHRCICVTCSQELKQGQNFFYEDAPSKQPTNSAESSRVSSQHVARSWHDRLLDWAKILLGFGYLLLEVFKK